MHANGVSWARSRGADGGQQGEPPVVLAAVALAAPAGGRADPRALATSVRGTCPVAVRCRCLAKLCATFRAAGSACHRERRPQEQPGLGPTERAACPGARPIALHPSRQPEGGRASSLPPAPRGNSRCNDARARVLDGWGALGGTAAVPRRGSTSGERGKPAETSAAPRSPGPAGRSSRLLMDLC